MDFPEIYDRWYNYLQNLDPEKPLPTLPEVENERQRLFLTGRNIYTQYHSLKQLEERLNKFKIYAPFDGTVTEVMINEGTLVMQGQRLGEFVKTGVYELESSVGLEEKDEINVGDTVKMNSVQLEKSYQGYISRINEKVDQQTQTIDVYVRVEGDELTTGMYMEGKVSADKFPSAVRIPREVLVDENHVFVVKDSLSVLTDVEVLHLTDEEAVVSGIEDNAAVILGDRTAAFEDTKVSPTKAESP